MRVILLCMTLAPAALLIAAWAAAPPERADDPVSLATEAAGPALARVAEWYRAGPGDARPDWDAARRDVLGGDARRAPAIMRASGCGTCHVIPGLPQAHGSVGPSLEGFADRAYVAGILPNRPGMLIDWLMHPTALAPETAMPDLGLTEGEARDVAAYLYRVR